jgi:hypothetical protein
MRNRAAMTITFPESGLGFSREQIFMDPTTLIAGIERRESEVLAELAW